MTVTDQPNKLPGLVHSERVKGRWPLCWTKWTIGARYTTSHIDERVNCPKCLEIMR